VCLPLAQGHESGAQVRGLGTPTAQALPGDVQPRQSVWIWEIPSSGEGGPVGAADVECLAACSRGHTQDVKMVKWHPTQTLALSASSKRRHHQGQWHLPFGLPAWQTASAANALPCSR